jgi:nitrogen fixation/metabolism regulation signal transduction histidine kinase
MKPLLSESEDQDALRMLGRASVQIVHDLKNQLNGLKLYATFLKKRLEKSERPAEELETVNKILEGLDRSARDASLIADYSRPIQLRKQAGVDLEKIVRQATTGLALDITINAAPERLVGEFDPVLLAEALKSVSASAGQMNSAKAADALLQVHLKDESVEGKSYGIIEWKILDSSDHDPFRSFAGSHEIRLALAAKVIEAHGGSAKRESDALCVRLPLDNK